jgi:hypothetical protein
MVAMGFLSRQSESIVLCGRTETANARNLCRRTINHRGVDLVTDVNTRDYSSANKEMLTENEDPDSIAA